MRLQRIPHPSRRGQEAAPQDQEFPSPRIQFLEEIIAVVVVVMMTEKQLQQPD
jgi:hypothetical protein